MSVRTPQTSSPGATEAFRSSSKEPQPPASQWSRARAAVTAYLAMSAANLGALTAGSDTLANVTQWLLLPLLVLVFMSIPPRGPQPLPRLRTATLAALGFSWLGDVVPDVVPEAASFLAMVGCFLLAQVSFIIGFWPHRDASILTRHRRLVLVYGAVFLTLVAACAGGAGPLLLPVVIYGLTLTIMAVLATGLGPLAGVGGAVFLLSDSLIALGAFRGWENRATSVAVMATYAVAELLLVLGVQRHRRQDGLAGAPTAA